ncbi:MAG: HPF/RaiA family ribosome-associated protein [Bdellovibrionales bacterium]
MIKINFKNLEKSEMAKDIVLERLNALIEKFEDLKKCQIQVTLEMENSKLQAGADLFSVKLHISQGRYKGITVKKSNSSMYIALGEVIEHMLEVLNRNGDKKRVVARNQSRSLLNHKA